MYDPAVVTHIVTTNRRIAAYYLAEYIGLESIDEVPDHIPTVKWSYINKLWEKGGYKPRVSSVAGKMADADNADADSDEQIEGCDPSIPADYELMFHAAFKTRIDAGIPDLMRKARPGPQKAKKTSTGHDLSRKTRSGSKGRDDQSDISTISCVVFANVPGQIVTLNAVPVESLHMIGLNSRSLSSATLTTQPYLRIDCRGQAAFPPGRR